MMAPTKMKLRVRKKDKSSAKSSQQLQQQTLCPETSPDSKCPICLDRFVNVASVERCLHRFCFRCIREWAKNKAECPLCKQPFRSIFHSVRAENDFKEFVVLEDNAQNATTSATAPVTMTAAAMVAAAAAPVGQSDAENAVTRTRRSRVTRTRQRRGQRAQDPAPSASSVDGVALDHATLMQRDPACLRQLLPWLRRERVMGSNPSELRPFLLARTDHILHELVSFARSIEAMQCPPAPSYEEDSGSQSSIINISEDDDSDEAAGTEDTTQDRVPPVPIATSSEISLSQSAWDDETPGPSYSTLSHSQTEEVEPDGNQSGGTGAATEQRDCNNEDNDEEEECMIVGYVKPMAERTPELVQLSSDSTEEEEVEVGGNETAAMETVMKVESSLPSLEQAAPVSPKSYPSTSHTERGENLEQSLEQDTAKTSHHRRQEHLPRRGFRKSHSLSGSRSHSSESSPHSGHSVTTGRSHIRPRRQGHRLLGRSPNASAERDASSSEDLVPTRSAAATREKSAKCFSPWDSPSRDGERKRKRRKKRRMERESERSRSPRRESRHRHSDRELWLHSSSSSSDTASRREKPAGKRKYKTRHLERTARRRRSRKSRDRERERERSPSVEIVFERRASDTHIRSRRHKKRRRKERVQNSPTIITIDSDSSSAAHKHHAEDDVPNDNAHRDGNHDNERVTDYSDHTIDYQERLAELSDRATDDKDAKNEDDSKDRAGDHSRAECANKYADGFAGASRRSSGAENLPDHHNHLADVRSGAADYKGVVTDVKKNSSENKDISACTTDSNKVKEHTADDQESLLDVEDFRDTAVLDMLNLEHCLVDVVQPIRRDEERRTATPLSDTRLLESDEGQGTPVNQQEAGLVAHRDQSEGERADVTRDSLTNAETSPDV